ncbi:unnamed protein product [Meloidogyne enterolobii]|uniref:Uncharacterized protein n=1 Tax=Meloidogyne enterolobii TaxID=390850 RepID=A0ACB0ZPC4_MELEN
MNSSSDIAFLRDNSRLRANSGLSMLLIKCLIEYSSCRCAGRPGYARRTNPEIFSPNSSIVSLRPR